MQGKAMTPGGSAEAGGVGRAQWRAQCRELSLRSALHKRQAGVPTYTVAEAAALLSVSPEHLYRMVRAGAFPAVQLRFSGDQGRYVVPARAVEDLLAAAAESGGCVDLHEWTSQAWPPAGPPSGGSAQSRPGAGPGRLGGAR